MPYTSCIHKSTNKDRSPPQLEGSTVGFSGIAARTFAANSSQHERTLFWKWLGHACAVAIATFSAAVFIWSGKKEQQQLLKIKHHNVYVFTYVMFRYLTEVASMTITDIQVVVELKIKQTLINLLSDKLTSTGDYDVRVPTVAKNVITFPQ